jgi:hypothetical protein
MCDSQGIISMMTPEEATDATALVESGLLAGDKDGMYGLRGQPRDDWGVPYSMTEVKIYKCGTRADTTTSSKSDQVDSTTNRVHAVLHAIATIMLA